MLLISLINDVSLSIVSENVKNIAVFVSLQACNLCCLSNPLKDLLLLNTYSSVYI